MRGGGKCAVTLFFVVFFVFFAVSESSKRQPLEIKFNTEFREKYKT